MAVDSKGQAQQSAMNLSWASLALILSLLLSIAGGIYAFAYLSGQVTRMDKDFDNQVEILNKRLDKQEQAAEVERLKFERDRQTWERFMGKMEGQRGDK